jgi:hypothetical protein
MFAAGISSSIAGCRTAGYVTRCFNKTVRFTIYIWQDYLNINRIFHCNFAAVRSSCKGKLVSRT